MRTISIITGLTGMAIIVYHLGWIVFLGMYLFIWSNNLDLKRVLK